MASKGKYCPPELDFRNFGDNACWQETHIDHETYVAMGSTLSSWRCVEGWRLETVCFDWLHNVYLGVGRDLVASGIWLFIRKGMYAHLTWNMMMMIYLDTSIWKSMPPANNMGTLECLAYFCFSLYSATCFASCLFWHPPTPPAAVGTPCLLFAISEADPAEQTDHVSGEHWWQRRVPGAWIEVQGLSCQASYFLGGPSEPKIR